MIKFVFKKEPEPMPEITFVDGTGASKTLSDFKGRVVLLNLWATWCLPCRKEMPALDRLQAAMGSDKFEVVALSLDRAGIEASRKFLDGIKIANLKLYVDPTARMNGPLKIFGMPTTILIDAQGREVGRLLGEAEWDSEDARKLIKASQG
jgi:thiol-disulfide isomerase/thioredoxin